MRILMVIVFALVSMIAPSGFAVPPTYKRSHEDMDNDSANISAEVLLANLNQQNRPFVPVKIVTLTGRRSFLTVLKKSDLSTAQKRCLESHISAAMDQDVQQLAKRLGVQEILITFSDTSDLFYSGDNTYGNILVKDAEIVENLKANKWELVYAEFATAKNKGDFELRQSAQPPTTVLRTIRIIKHVKDPKDSDATRLTYEVVSNGKIVEPETTVKIGGSNPSFPTRKDFLEDIEKRQLALYTPPAGYNLKALSTEHDRTAIALIQEDERMTVKKVLSLEALIAGVNGRRLCFSKDPTNDLITALNEKLSIRDGRDVRPTYPAHLGPRRGNR